ncbi:MAG: HupE/UreJ family protein [Armatimonadetes bacterium]|nr:HupE/UreJ family protein [Akkermansiaceae bacterium]
MTRISLLFIFAATAATAVVPRFFALGFTHILPNGPDHILFILALFFLSRNFGVLLSQMTLFTLAHSLTLGLALYGIVSVPTAVVEIAIALSIAFVAIENLFQDRLSRWRPFLVFSFGLIHGLGFAHSFQEMPLHAGDFLPALFSFNMGIEFGQLAVVGLAYLALAIWGRREEGFKMIARPASTLIALTGIYWAIQRGVA